MDSSPSRLPYELKMEVAATDPVFIVGVWKRSGTNFVADLLSLHSSFELPKPLWEATLLRSSELLQRYVQNRIAGWEFWIREANEDPQVLQQEFMQHVGLGLLSFMCSRIGPGRRLLCKTPFTENLDTFPELFPQAKLLIVVRDGRDSVESSHRTWSKHSLRSFAKKWASWRVSSWIFPAESGKLTRSSGGCFATKTFCRIPKSCAI